MTLCVMQIANVAGEEARQVSHEIDFSAKYELENCTEYVLRQEGCVTR